MNLISKKVLLGLFLLSSSLVCSQSQDSAQVKTTLIKLEHADILSFDEKIDPEAQILTGDVRFRHDDFLMFCDTAYYYEARNSLDAFGHVRMEQGDTVVVFGDKLYYDGFSQMARLRKNVRMQNGQVTLLTDSLNYDRAVNIGYFFNRGQIIDSLNVLSSVYGEYSPTTNDAVFKDSVKLENSNFTLYSDTLNYNTITKIATILGPSEIVADSGVIYTSRGWYDTVNNKSVLLKRSKILSGDKILEGDSIIYDQLLGYGEVFGNMSIQDTLQSITLEGHYGYYNEITGFAFATDSARALEYSQSDTLFLHADTLFLNTLDSVSRELKAYYNVRFYRTDIQGVCDSMQFNTRDSILYLHKDPILWNDQFQMFGDTILVLMNDSTIDCVHVKGFAFAAQFLDTTYYNQLKGSELKAYFEGSFVRQIDIMGNAESIFYPQEAGEEMIGMNESKSGFMSIWIIDGRLDKLKIWPNPMGVLTPILNLRPEQKTLKDFYWYDYLRPLNRDDVFNVRKRKEEDEPKRTSDRFVF